ncbi:helix-turn-helix domain-containing protein [Pelagicoccus sp. SDUM812003]|uniref:ArsR/SmtB family transcription factor n=1 Tax=Pelagicoccus sp. SDUM812003 TaxID=3041267 RepID=UPI00280DF483|nr:helix-turn-helix domain-containing protein [Pelagicoccus sp. SDUM812003]MDQ8201380.1 helix-turn-helix domain-containing protein [Pelagicoccus sp. SDUM812003]
MKRFTHPDLSEVSLSEVLHALSDPCRQRIVRILKEAEGRELACNEIPLEVSKATGSHHFETLRQAGLIKSRADGTKCLSSLREEEVELRFPGLLELVTKESGRDVSEVP